MTEIKLLNEEIISAHNKHYENNPNGLLIPDGCPNGNLMFHLYNTGEISLQKGGSAYLRRSEFKIKYELDKYEKLNLKFIKLAGNDISTYVILTEKECYYYRDIMVKLLEKYND